MDLSADPSSPALVPSFAPRRAGLRHALGGALIVAVWLSLWTWIALGVAAPLSSGPAAEALARLA